MKSEHKITKEEHHWTRDEKVKWLVYGEWVENDWVKEAAREEDERNVRLIRTVKNKMWPKNEGPNTWCVNYSYVDERYRDPHSAIRLEIE